MPQDIISIRNEIKAEIAKSGWTLTDIVKEINKLHPDNTTTSQNISNKLTRGTLKYPEAREIAFIIGTAHPDTGTNYCHCCICHPRTVPYSTAIYPQFVVV